MEEVGLKVASHLYRSIDCEKKRAREEGREGEGGKIMKERGGEKEDIERGDGMR